MTKDIWIGLLLPLVGTALGSGCVFFLRKGDIDNKVEKSLIGFAAGVMTQALVGSLLLPALDLSKESGSSTYYLPVIIGFWIGIGFLLLLDTLVPHLHRGNDKAEGMESHLSKSTMMLLAVTLHNIPEGMAVGIVYAGVMSGNVILSASAAFTLALGIAIQNFPEGAVVSIPLYSDGKSKSVAFWDGVLTGVVEPLGAILMIFFAQALSPTMPSLLSFAAGAMMYVVVEELIPEMSSGEHSNIGVIMFSIGFTLMMVLDIVLG